MLLFLAAQLRFSRFCSLENKLQFGLSVSQHGDACRGTENMSGDLLHTAEHRFVSINDYRQAKLVHEQFGNFVHWKKRQRQTETS